MISTTGPRKSRMGADHIWYERSGTHKAVRGLMDKFVVWDRARTRRDRIAESWYKCCSQRTQSTQATKPKTNQQKPTPKTADLNHRATQLDDVSLKGGGVKNP